MKHGTPFLIVAVAVALAGCGHAAQGTPEQMTQVAKQFGYTLEGLRRLLWDGT